MAAHVADLAHGQRHDRHAVAKAQAQVGIGIAQAQAAGQFHGDADRRLRQAGFQGIEQMLHETPSYLLANAILGGRAQPRQSAKADTGVQPRPKARGPA